MRTFAFGCSLTQYFYPTWADILIHHYKQEVATVGEGALPLQTAGALLCTLAVGVGVGVCQPTELVRLRVDPTPLSD